MLKRMFKTSVLIGVLGSAAAAGLHHWQPALWVQAERKASELTGWTEDARQVDPVGFVNHAAESLERDLDAMEETRRELAAEIGELTKKIREQEAMQAQALRLADEFRGCYREASLNGDTAVVVCNAAYTEEQVKTQVRMLLAESAGYEAAVESLREIQDEAERQLESLTVRIDSTEAQLAALPAQGQVLAARTLSRQGEELLVQVQELMDGNDRVIADNPVRNVRQLTAASNDSPAKARPGDEAVEVFLAQVEADPTETVVEEEPVQRAEEGETPLVDQAAVEPVAEATEAEAVADEEEFPVQPAAAVTEVEEEGEMDAAGSPEPVAAAQLPVPNEKPQQVQSDVRERSPKPARARQGRKNRTAAEREPGEQQASVSTKRPADQDAEPRKLIFQQY